MLLLDGLVGHSGSQHIIFQAGTALRWVAVLDTLHLRKALPAADELDWDAVNRNAMRTMAKSFPPFR